MMTGQNMAPSIVSGVSGLTQALVGAPPWCVIACLALSLALGALQVVFPQESADRLAWWTGRRSYLSQQRLLRTARRREQPPVP